MIEINGNFTLTLDLKEAITVKQRGAKVIGIGEFTPEMANLEIINGAILMPPCGLFQMRFDNNNPQTLGMFDMEYCNYLSSPEVSDYLSAMVTALVAGENIFVYMTRDEYELYFPNFAGFMFNKYGVCTIDRYANIIPQAAPYVVRNEMNAQHVAMAVLLATSEAALVMFEMPIMEPKERNISNLMPYVARLAYEFGMAERLYIEPPEIILMSILSICEQYRQGKKRGFKTAIDII